MRFNATELYELTEPLDFYFHTKLRRTRLLIDIEKEKRDLVSETLLQVLLKLHGEQYNDYNLKALVWTKAQDIWRRFIVKYMRKASKIAALEEENLNERVADSLMQLEQASFLQFVQSTADRETWAIFVMRAEGMKYKEIAQILSKDEGAIRTKVSRFRQMLETMKVRRPDAT